MRVLLRAIGLLALLTVAGAGVSASVAAQAGTVQLVTAADTSRIFGGDWTGSCTPATGIAVNCNFSDPSDVSRQVTAEVVYPTALQGAAVFDAWRASMEQEVAAAPGQWTAVAGVGDGAYLNKAGSAGAVALQFYDHGALGFIATSIPATTQQVTD